MGCVVSYPELDEATGLPIGGTVDATPAGWPGARVLPGQIVRLELLDPAIHANDLWDSVGGAHNSALWLYMSDGPFSNRPDFDAVVQNAARHEDPIFYAIVNQHNSVAVGWCALLNIRPKHRSVEVGYLMFSTKLQRTPAATETIYLLARYVFDELHYRRFEWKCNALNAKSRRAAERFGFTFEGIFRQHMIVKGRNRDSAWFSMTVEEWPGVRRAFETWLAPANLDADGNQRERLSDLISQNRG